MTEEERIFKGMLFASEEPELVKKKLKAHRMSQEYSLTFEEDSEARNHILKELLSEIGEGTFMLGQFDSITAVIQKSARIAL